MPIGVKPFRLVYGRKWSPSRRTKMSNPRKLLQKEEMPVVNEYYFRVCRSPAGGSEAEASFMTSSKLQRVLPGE